MILDPALFYLQGTWHNYAKSNQMDPVGSLIAFKSYPRPGKISPTKIRFPRIRAFCKMEEKGMEGCTSPTASSPQFLRTVMNGPSIQETGDWDLIQGCPASRWIISECLHQPPTETGEVAMKKTAYQRLANKLD
jgi:hypothetical protein